jgi:hypothetical protein
LGRRTPCNPTPRGGVTANAALRLRSYERWVRPTCLGALRNGARR